MRHIVRRSQALCLLLPQCVCRYFEFSHSQSYTNGVRLAAERAYVVWCPMADKPRWRTPAYLVCFTSVVLYLGVVCHLFIGMSLVQESRLLLTAPIVRIAHMNSIGHCSIGFRLDGVIMLVAFDAYVSNPFSFMFMNASLTYHSWTELSACS